MITCYIKESQESRLSKAKGDCNAIAFRFYKKFVIASDGAAIS